MSIWWKVGAYSGALAIGLGAFGAHGLRNSVTEERLLKAYETGAHYHLVHSFALLFCSFISPPHSKIAGGLFLTGITLFSGSLYLMALTKQKQLGMITPFGGIAFIGGWIALALGTKSSFPKIF